MLATFTIPAKNILHLWKTKREQHIIHAITDIHCCFSSNIISCCATCFAQIEMFLIKCYNSSVSLGYPPTCNEAIIYLISTLEKHSSKPTKLKM